MLCVAINWGKAFTDRWFFLWPTQAEWQKEGGKFKTSLFFYLRAYYTTTYGLFIRGNKSAVGCIPNFDGGSNLL
jgi:hypothetical protein